MSIISYEQPDLINSAPTSFEGNPFPYNVVSNPRRFEELIYSIYKIKIARSEFSPYDSISLMNGVREKGRDCALFNGGRNYGLIQCKKYEKSLSKDQFGKEITKFALYSLLEPSLIFNPDEFEYYVAVAGGLTNECITFIDEFTHQIKTERKLSSWITENLELPTLAGLKISDPEPKTLEILSKIKVKKILPQDLDSLLYEPAIEHIIPLFFKVRTLTDNSHIQELKENFKRFTDNRLTREQIAEELKRGSGSLRFQNNEIEEILDSHIERSETAQLIAWVENPLEKDKAGNEKNVCLLAGDAGIGKTVILKDVYDGLAQKSIPVLALKADKLYPANIQELQIKTNLSVPVYDFIEQCKQQYDKTVILIDQIDALSQSMSSDRNYLHVFRQLIDYYTYDENVRIIISVRIFDLEYDPSLKIYKDIQKIKVGLLTESEVRTQLAKINLDNNALSPKLLQLLRTPNHLNIFSIVNAKRSNSVTGFTSIQELYSELWLQKIINSNNQDLSSDRLKIVLYRIAAKMFSDQRISVNSQLFENEHKEIIYLESERILIVDGKQIQFFHQSFYDYVFAKNFVERGTSLVSYIKNQKQTILIRSAVKMIVGYLRDYDHLRYIKEITGLLNSGSIYFHIKHLLVSLMAALDQPSDRERGILIKHIDRSRKLKTVFFEHAPGSGWTETVFNSKMLDFMIEQPDTSNSTRMWNLYQRLFPGNHQDRETEQYHLREICCQYLRIQLNMSNETVFDFALGLNDQSLLRWLCFTLKEWSNPKALLLFNKCANFRETDSFGYFHTLENMVPELPEIVFNQVKDSLFTEDYFEGSRNHDHYDEKKLIKQLTDRAPYIVIDQLLDNLEHQINNPKLAELDFNGDYKYKEVYLKDNTDPDNPGLLYKCLANCLRLAATEDHVVFKQFNIDFKNNVNQSYLRLLIYAYESDVKGYASGISDLLHHLHQIDKLKSDGLLNVEFRMLFEKAFPHFSHREKQNAISLIRNLAIKDELYLYEREGKKKHYLTWGLTKYFFLKRLPPEVLEKDEDLKKMFQELYRKFYNKVDTVKLQTNIATAVGRPLSQHSYTKMSADNWIRSFKKYDNDNPNWGDNFHKGGMHEHSWAFKEYISKNLNQKNIDLVCRVVNDDDIKPTYKIRGIYGLTDAHADPATVQPLIELMIKNRQYKDEQSLFMSAIGYLFQFDFASKTVVDFTINEALNGETPEHWKDKELNEVTAINGLVSAAINSSKGKAAECLCFINDKNYEDLIFYTLEQLLNKECAQISAVIYFRYAYLMRLNDERAFKLFVKYLSKEKNIIVITSAIWSLQYLSNHDFDRLLTIFEKLIDATNLGEDESRGVSTILFISWLKGNINAKKLYIDFLNRNQKRHFWAIHDAFEHFYLFNDSPQKCLEILFFLLKTAKLDQNSKQLNFQLFKLEEIKFQDIKSLINAYIESKAIKMSEDLIKYLTVSCKDEPFECVDLFSKAIRKRKKLHKDDHFRNDDHATQFIIAGFSSIKENDRQSREYRKKLLKSFDKVLADFRFRTKAEQILDTI